MRDPLFHLEESRKDKIENHKNVYAAYIPKPYYFVDLDFQNIAKLYVETKPIEGRRLEADLVSATIYVVVKRPCQVLKLYPQHQKRPQFVRSPFKMEGDPFLNFWNLHQVLYF